MIKHCDPGKRHSLFKELGNIVQAFAPHMRSFLPDILDYVIEFWLPASEVIYRIVLFFVFVMVVVLFLVFFCIFFSLVFFFFSLFRKDPFYLFFGSFHSSFLCFTPAALPPNIANNARCCDEPAARVAQCAGPRVQVVSAKAAETHHGRVCRRRVSRAHGHHPGAFNTLNECTNQHTNEWLNVKCF